MTEEKKIPYKSKKSNEDGPPFHAVSRQNPDAIFILGNQKSGTSAIAHLLSFATGIPATIDLKNEITNPTCYLVRSGEVSFSEFLDMNKEDFTRPIIKEPSLTILFNELRQTFKNAKFVFVVRDPRDNIRSILDRLKIPGDLRHLKQVTMIPRAWHVIINNVGLDLRGKSYIEKLAHRWNHMAEIYLRNKEHFILIRYELFLSNKIDTITSLANLLGVRTIYDVASRVDEQFQPAGMNRDKSWSEFYNKRNLLQIERICRHCMVELGYPPGK
jgi:hypothetical protein